MREFDLLRYYLESADEEDILGLPGMGSKVLGKVRRWIEEGGQRSFPGSKRARRALLKAAQEFFESTASPSTAIVPASFYEQQAARKPAGGPPDISYAEDILGQSVTGPVPEPRPIPKPGLSPAAENIVKATAVTFGVPYDVLADLARGKDASEAWETIRERVLAPLGISGDILNSMLSGGWTITPETEFVQLGSGAQARILAAGRPLDPGKSIPGYEKWPEGFVFRGSKRTPFRAEVLSESWPGAYTTHGVPLVAQPIDTEIGMIKLAKRVQLENVYRQLEMKRYGQSVAKHAPFPLSSVSSRLDVGFTPQAVILLQEVLPEGMAYITKGGYSASWTVQRRIPVPKDFDESKITAESEAVFTPGEEIRLIEGGKPLDLGLGRSWDEARLIQTFVKDITSQEGSLIGKEVIAQFEMSTRIGGGQVSFKAPGAKFLVAEGTGTFEVEGAGDYDVLMTPKDPTHLAYMYWAARPEEAAKAAGLSLEELRQTPWRRLSPVLYKKFREEVLPQIAKRGIVSFRVHESQLGMYPSDIFEWERDPSYDKTRMYRVRTKEPVPYLETSVFLTARKEWPTRKVLLREQALEYLREFSPGTYRAAKRLAYRYSRAAADIVGTVAMNVGLAEPSGYHEVTPEDVEKLTGRVSSRLGVMPSELGEVDPGRLAKAYLEEAVGLFGWKRLKTGSGMLLPSPRAISVYSTTEQSDEERAIALARSYGLALAQLGGPDETSSVALRAVTEKTLELANTGAIRKKLSGLYLGGGKLAAGFPATASTVIPANVAVMAEERMLTLLGLKPGSERAEAFLKAWRAGEVTPTAHIIGQPVPGDFPFRGTVRVYHPEHARRLFGDTGLRDEAMLAVSQTYAEALGRDFDADYLYAILTGRVTDKGEWRQFRGTPRRFSEKEVIEQAEFLKATGRPSLARGEGFKTIEELQEALNPANLQEAPPEVFREALGVQHKYKTIIGGQYNILVRDLLSSIPRERRRSIEAFSKMIYGYTQTPKPLPKGLQELVDIIQTYTPTGGIQRSLEGPVSRKHGWAGFKGIAPLRSALLSPLLQEEALSPEIVASLITPEGAEGQMGLVSKLVQRFREAPERQLQIMERLQETLGGVETWFRKAPIGRVTLAHVVGRAYSTKDPELLERRKRALLRGGISQETIDEALELYKRFANTRTFLYTGLYGGGPENNTPAKVNTLAKWLKAAPEWVQQRVGVSPESISELQEKYSAQLKRPVSGEEVLPSSRFLQRLESGEITPPEEPPDVLEDIYGLEESPVPGAEPVVPPPPEPREEATAGAAPMETLPPQRPQASVPQRQRRAAPSSPARPGVSPSGAGGSPPEPPPWDWNARLAGGGKPPEPPEEPPDWWMEEYSGPPLDEEPASQAAQPTRQQATTQAQQPVEEPRQYVRTAQTPSEKSAPGVPFRQPVLPRLRPEHRAALEIIPKLLKTGVLYQARGPEAAKVLGTLEQYSRQMYAMSREAYERGVTSSEYYMFKESISLVYRALHGQPVELEGEVYEGINAQKQAAAMLAAGWEAKLTGGGFRKAALQPAEREALLALSQGGKDLLEQALLDPSAAKRVSGMIQRLRKVADIGLEHKAAGIGSEYERVFPTARAILGLVAGDYEFRLSAAVARGELEKMGVAGERADTAVETFLRYAPEETISSVRGIGPKTLERIREWRERGGPLPMPRRADWRAQLRSAALEWYSSWESGGLQAAPIVGRLAEMGALREEFWSGPMAEQASKVLSSLRSVSGDLPEGERRKYEQMVALSRRKGFEDLSKQLEEASRRVEEFGKLMSELREPIQNVTKELRGLADVSKERALTPEEMSRLKDIRSFLRESGRIAAAAGEGGAIEEAERLLQQTQLRQAARAITGSAAEPQGLWGRISRALEARAPGGRSLLYGDLGAFSFALFNMQRVWALTGGRFGRWMGEYAQYTELQRQVLASVGAQAPLGPAQDILASRAAMERLTLGLGRSAWDVWGWVPRAISGLGGEQAEGSALGRLLAFAAPIGAMPLIARMGASAAALYGKGALAGALAGAAGVMAPVAATAVAGYAALEVGRAVRGDEDVGQTLGAGLRWGRAFGAMAVGAVPLAAGKIAQAVGARGVAAELGEAAWQIAGGSIEDARRYEAQIAGVGARTPGELRTLRDISSSLQRVAGIGPSEATAIVGQYMQITGRTLDQISLRDITAMSAMSHLSSQNLSEMAQWAITAMRAQGIPMGSEAMPEYLTWAMRLTPAEKSVAGDVTGRMASVRQMMGRYGLFQPFEFDIRNLTKEQAALMSLQFGRFFQGSQTLWSQIGLEQGRPEWVTVSPVTGLPIGTAEGGGILARFITGRQQEAFVPIRGVAGAAATGSLIGAPTESIRSLLSVRGTEAYLDLGREGFRNVPFTMWGVQDASVALSRQEQDRGLARRMEELQLRWSYTTGLGGPFAGRGVWQFQDQMIGLQRAYREDMFRFQEESLGLSDRQFRERWQMQWERAIQGARWTEEDIARRRQRIETQYQWTIEDIAFRGEGAALEFGWAMEDFDVALRHARGRQRRQLMRQRERAVIRYARQMERLETEEERAGTRKKWAEEDLERERERFERRRQWMIRELEMSRKHHEERMQLQRRRLQRERQYFHDVNALQDRRRKAEREYWTMLHKRQEEELKHQQQVLELTRKLQDAQMALARAQQAQIAEFRKAFEEGGIVREAFNEFARKVATDFLPGGQLPDAVDAFARYTEASLLTVVQKMFVKAMTLSFSDRGYRARR